MHGPGFDHIKYGYDRAGNRLWRENVVTVSLNKDFDELYAYDGLYRLMDMQRGRLNTQRDAVTNKTFAQQWLLDATGNWGNFKEDDDGDGTWNLDQDRTANRVNEITDISETAGSGWITPAYSRVGNMTTVPQPAGPTAGYATAFDAWNRLVKLTEGANTVQENEYDGLRRRTVRKDYVSGSLDETRHFYYSDSWQVLEERVGTSTAADRQFVWGLRYLDDCLLRDRDTNADGTPDERLYSCQDANWNIIAITDAVGDVQERYAYSAYGAPAFFTPTFGSRTASQFAWEILYCGYRYESATRLFHVRRRIYLPLLGSWVQRDPIFHPGTSAYQYVDNNPVIHLDPSGRDTHSTPTPGGGRMWIPLPLNPGAPAGCPAPQQPLLPGNFKPPLPNGCAIYQDYCNLGIIWGCNAYWFCMTAGNNPDSNCARACIQSNLPPANNAKGPNVNPCSNMRDAGFTCACLFYREQACISACAAGDDLPWLPPPTPGAFAIACRTPINPDIIPPKPGKTIPPVPRPCPPVEQVPCKLG